MIRRNLAQRLSDHVLDVVPPQRREWARGMASEVDHIDDDGAALAFAAGAVWTGYRQGFRLWSNWLRVGRWGAALGTALLAVGLFYMSAWLQQVPDAARPSVPFSGLTALLGAAYLGVGWGLARRKSRLFLTLVAGIVVLLTAAALAFWASNEAASPWAAYAALLQGEPSPRHAYYAALLLEQYVLIIGLSITGAILWRFERRGTAA